jgi:hypothetical protein
MKHIRNVIRILAIFSVSLLSYCDNAGDEPQADCNLVSISIQSSVTAGSCGSTSGAISASATGGAAPYQFRINNGSFQATGEFTSLAPGEYNLEVKDNNGCISSAMAEVNSGISFQNTIQPIIEANCAVSGCHVDGTGRPDFTQLTVVQSRAALIKSRTTAKSMPPAGSGISLTDEQIEQIACWVDDGAPAN